MATTATTKPEVVTNPFNDYQEMVQTTLRAFTHTRKASEKMINSLMEAGLAQQETNLRVASEYTGSVLKAQFEFSNKAAEMVEKIVCSQFV